MLELELRQDAPPKSIPQSFEPLREALVGGEHEIDRVARIKIELRREPLLYVVPENRGCRGDRVRSPIVRQVEDQPLNVLFCQGLTVYVKHETSLPHASASFPTAGRGMPRGAA